MIGILFDGAFIIYKEDKQKVLEEAIRVTKKQGHILVAYCMNEATMIQFTFKAGKIWECVDATFDMWMKYHFSICERMDLIGATNHALDNFGKKSISNCWY